MGPATVKEEAGGIDRGSTIQLSQGMGDGAACAVKQEPLTNGEAAKSTVSPGTSPSSGGVPAAMHEGQELKGGQGGKKHGSSNGELKRTINPPGDLFIHTVVTRHQAMVLRELKGGDGAILLALTEKFGVKLVGRKGLGASGEEVLAALMKARARRRKADLF